MFVALARGRIKTDVLLCIRENNIIIFHELRES